MILRFIKDSEGSPDGIDVISFKAGKTYIVPKSLIIPFVSTGVAIEVIGEINLKEVEIKPQKPKNKKRKSLFSRIWK